MPPTKVKPTLGIRDTMRDFSSTLANQTKDNRITNRLVDSGSLPESQREIFPQRGGTGFRVNVPPSIPSTALNGDTSISDVFARRNEMEQTQQAEQQFDTDLSALNGRIGTVSPSFFTNPEQTINRLLLNRPTDTQTELDTRRQAQADQTRGFATQLQEVGQEARTELGIPELQSNLAETRNRIAERTTRLRQTLRDFETNAARRGVDRQFVESERQNVQAEAAAELADLAIIESAQLGNLNEARAEVDSVINQAAQAFELENAAIEQEIARLESINTREADVRSEQLQIALAERERNIAQTLQNEKDKREMLIQAAANGADQATLDAIRNSRTAEEATFIASPFIGRLDRLQTEASIRASNQSASTSRTNQLIALAEIGNPEAIKELGITLPDNSQPSSDLIAYAQEYAATGKIPSGLKDAGISFGDVSELAKDMPKPTGTVVNRTTGVAPTNVSPTLIEGYAVVKDLIEKSDRLAELNEQRTKGLITGTVAANFGSDLQQEYLDLRQEIVDLLSRARTGAALTASEERFYAEQLPGVRAEPLFGVFSPDSSERIRNNFKGKLEDTLRTKLDSQGLTMYGFSTVKAGEQEFKVGEIIENTSGQRGIVNPDGSVTPIN